MDKDKPNDKNIFKKIIRENWIPFKEKYPEFNNAYYNEVISKMLGCGEEENGHACYICCSCGETVKVGFSCKSSFCLSCGKTYTDNWVEQIGETLYEGVYYRHSVLTVPEELRNYFFKDPRLLEGLIKLGPKMLTNTLSYWFKKEVEVGYIVVLQTAGRSGHYNPHLHILMTSGGICKETGKWKSLEYIKYELLHKEWQKYLFSMLRERVGTWEIHEKLKRLEEKYANGLVAYIDRGKMPKTSQGLARYLAKYVVSPPIAISRILEYDGETVVYWYNDHKSGKTIERVPVLRFVGLMVQHILPKGFQRVRYYGLHATCKRPKVLLVLKKIMRSVKKAIKGAYKIIKKTFRQRVMDSGCKDPLKCKRCGDEMFLYYIWHPVYGRIYDGKHKLFEECCESESEKETTGAGSSGIVGDRERSEVQMLMSFMQV